MVVLHPNHFMKIHTLLSNQLVQFHQYFLFQYQFCKLHSVKLKLRMAIIRHAPLIYKPWGPCSIRYLYLTLAFYLNFGVPDEF
jgi:hypothetical protein